MSIVTIYEVTGVPRTEEYDPEGSESLTQLQKAVGGYIEIIELDDEVTMVINEEGKLKGLPLNADATALAISKGRLFQGDFIVGPAVVMRSEDLR